MTEEEIRAIVAAAFAQAATAIFAQFDPERNIQVDTVMDILSTICNDVATTIAIVP